MDDNYEIYSNLPKINGVTLKGDLSFEDLGLEPEEVTAEELENMWGDD